MASKSLSYNNYIILSYIAVAMYSRDRYKIIGLRKISHFIKQPCRNAYLEKVLQLHQSTLAKQSGKSNFLIYSELLKFQGSAKFRQPAIRPGSTRCRPSDFSQVMYSYVPFTNFSIC